MLYLYTYHVTCACGIDWSVVQETEPVHNTATHCNTLQHTATHCNTRQHTATICNTSAGDGATMGWL